MRVNVVGEAYEIIYEALYAILETSVFGIEPCTVVVGDADNWNDGVPDGSIKESIVNIFSGLALIPNVAIVLLRGLYEYVIVFCNSVK